MELTYQQILAEQYDENAKTVLVQQQDYEEEDVDDYNYEDYDENELPDRADFNKFPGDRNKPEHVLKPAKDPDTKHREKVRVRTQVVNIDGKFRGAIVPTNPMLCSGMPAEDSNPGTDSAYFVFYPSRPYKNIKSIKLTSLEFPNTFYTFEAATRENTIMTIQTAGAGGIGGASEPVLVSDGNYATVADLVGDIQALLPAHYTIALHPRTNKITISTTYVYPGETLPRDFRIGFPSTPGKNPNSNGIGYNLGFLNTDYIGPAYDTVLGKYFTAETVPDVVQDTYVYLSVNDYNLVEQPVYGQTHFNALAKITLPGAKNSIVYDNNYLNSSAKEYMFHQPTNINRLEIRILDAYGSQVDLKGASFSMTLELQEVLDPSIYEALLGP